VQLAPQKPTLLSWAAAVRHVNEKIHHQNGLILEDAPHFAPMSGKNEEIGAEVV
jgi:hypothetical protein